VCLGCGGIGARAAGVAVGLVLAGVVLPGAPARAATGMDCLSVGADSTPQVDTDATSKPLESMRVEEAQGLVDGGPRREPVRVAVLDSGVAAGPLVDVVAAPRVAATSRNLIYGHGTAVAGLIAGHRRSNGKALGVAPDADIVDVRVYDADTPDPTASPPQMGVTTEAVVQGLDWVARNATALNIRVANVSLAVAPSRALRAAVERAWRADVVVVAASGNRPQEGQLDHDRFGEYRPGEDAAAFVAPAGYDHVVAVNATVAGAGDVDLSDFVLQNGATDVAVPTAGAISLAANGSTCLLPDVATSWAAAEVSGVVALLRARFPDETAAQVVARLLGTADGSVDDPTPLRGAGVVQPVEALTRPLHPDGRGVVPRARPDQGRTPRATAPEPEADVLAATREHAVWWGLLGGGALLLALVLRPLLARRRG
jgi:membrane-anchored mycosin MYCP